MRDENTCEILLEERRIPRPLRRPTPKKRGGWVVDIKGLLKKYFVRIQVGSSADSCKHGHKPSDTTIGGGFVNSLATISF
jgi:hypothetical protein